jgi:cobalt-zinc-cadmium resistance protein CzcA
MVYFVLLNHFFMLNKIIHWSIANKLIVAILTLGLIVWGLFSLSNLPIDAVPDITNNQVQIVTSAPSSGAEDIERFVTFPVEQTMATIPGIEEIRSFSRFGLSVVTVVFDESTDVYWARQQVAERLSEAKSQIPAGFGEPSMAPLSTGLGEIYQYIIKPKKGYENKFNATDLRTIQDWTIRRQLLGVEGIPEAQAIEIVEELMKDKIQAHQVLVKEELGINSEELQGSAMEAALSSFFLFGIGAVIPVLPFMFTDGIQAIVLSAVFSSIGLFLIGAAITLFTGKNVWYSGFRQVFFGLAAAAVTFGIGKLIGISLAG